MAGQRTDRIWAGFDIVSRLSAAAFFASMPLLLAPLDAVRSVLSSSSSEQVLEPLVSSPFLAAVALGAMFASLAMLFVCLLKTAYARLSRRMLLVAAGAYLAGMLITCSAGFIAAVPTALFMVAGALMGVGGAVLCMAWARQVRIPDLHAALGTLTALGASVFAVDAGLLLFPVPLKAVALFLLAGIGVFGCLRGAFALIDIEDRATTSGSNWWDVFGRLDLSLLEGASEFSTPLSRVLLFIVTPAVVFLLFVTGMNMHHTAYGDVPVEVIGGSIAIACAIPLLFVKSERAVINVSYRMYLPAIAAIVFVVGDFAPVEFRGLFLSVGVYGYCFVYGLLMCAMIITMMGRMKSLALPAACMLVIAAALIAMLAYANIDAGALGAYRLNALLGLLLVSVVLLVAMPSSRIWRVLLEGIDLSNAVEVAEEPRRDAMPLEKRCDLLARSSGLTPRESEIFRYLGRGYGSAYIADELVIAESTVRSHVKSIYRKIGVTSREELISRIDEIGETPENDL